MIREVDLVSYLPEFIKKYKEPAAALKAEDPEFAIVWKAADRALKNEFIATADEYGIARFERMMRIFPLKTDTLESRRNRIQNRWINFVPYTVRVLSAKIAELLGEHNFSIYADFSKSYKMDVIVYIFNEQLAEELKQLLSTMTPMNIAVEIIWETVTSAVTLCFGAVAEEADILELRQR